MLDQEVMLDLREFKGSRGFVVILARKGIQAAKAPKEIWVLRDLPDLLV